jgi:hypothetical protein
MLDRTEEINNFARETLLGDLMAAAMKQMRSLDKPWTKVDELAQRRIIDQVRDDIGDAVLRAVDLIISDDRTRFRAKVDQVTFKEGVKAVLLMGNNEWSHELADVAGGTVLVVIEDPARYISGAVPVAEADQHALI